MRSTYIVSYDISDPKRLRLVFKLMKGWGIHVQYSVFQCDLDAKDVSELQSAAEDLIDPTVDQILFIDLGPTQGRAQSAIQAIGRPYTFPDTAPIIA